MWGYENRRTLCSREVRPVRAPFRSGKHAERRKQDAGGETETERKEQRGGGGRAAAAADIDDVGHGGEKKRAEVARDARH